MIDSTHHERTILGAMLTDRMALMDGAAILEPRHFALDSHQRIFAAMQKLAGKSVEVNFISLRDELQASKELDSVGGLPYLLDLEAGIPRNYDITYSARVVRDASALRSLASIGQRLTQESLLGEAQPVELLGRLREDLADLEQANARDEMVTMEQLVPATMHQLLHPDEREEPISTGLHELDAITRGGIRPKELWICGALPSRGKTSVARQMARGAASKGIPVAIFSIEMANEQWNRLDLAVVAGVDPRCVRSGQRPDKDQTKRLIEAADVMIHWPMHYEDSGKIHIRALISKARLAVMKRGVRLVIVDYLQRVKSDDKDIRIRVGAVGEALAEFAKDSSCAVLALSQLARRGDINSRPTMQDLKESGDLEAHAHTIVLNYRPVERDGGALETFTGQDEIIIGKQRFGPIGSFPVSYNPQTLSFESRRA